MWRAGCDDHLPSEREPLRPRRGMLIGGARDNGRATSEEPEGAACPGPHEDRALARAEVGVADKTEATTLVRAESRRGASPRARVRPMAQRAAGCVFGRSAAPA